MRTKKQTAAADRAEGKRGPGRPSAYRPLYADALIAWFERAGRQVEDVERVATRDGGRYIQRPVAPPTISGFAVAIGVSRQTVHRWGEAHPEFSEALDRARTIAEDVTLRMAALGAWNASIATLALKNLHGWSDKSQVDVTGGPVRLVFDAQDRDA